MAIIGNIQKIKEFLKEKKLGPVFSYFTQALDTGSEVHKRIFGLAIGSFEKVTITNDVFALEQVYFTKDREQCFIESHRRYIDFQLILQGIEQMEYVDIDKITVDCPYDEKKDLITYKMQNNTSKLVMQKGDIAIFFPDDAHVGLPQYQESSLVRKTVIKLPVELY